MKPKEVIEAVCREVGDVLAQVQEDGVILFVDELLRARHIFVTGEGRSGLVGKAFAMRLMHVGLPAYAVGDIVTPAIGPDDLLVAISGSGRTAVTLTIANRAIEAGAQVFLVSSNRDSPIARLVHHVLVIPGKTKVDEGKAASVQPMGSLFDQSAHLLLDAVCVLLMHKLDVQAADLKARHTNL